MHAGDRCDDLLPHEIPRPTLRVGLFHFPPGDSIEAHRRNYIGNRAISREK